MTLFPIPTSEEYKGFHIESCLNHFRIVFDGKKHRLFFCGEGKGSQTFDLSINIAKARPYTSVSFCKHVIDEIIKDHCDWVDSLKGRKIARSTNEQDAVVY